MIQPDLEAELAARIDYLSTIDGNLVLDTPDDVIDREFRFAKIRASESIFKTAGGYMHGPGGESYYAAIWANDQAEYVNPLFPFLGYWKGDNSALNSYMHFARFMNPEYKPIPSSIIAEGIDIWDGAGDRGDAAMIAHGASRYALEKGDKAEAEQLWPLIEWCLEYCHRKLNADGVVLSDSDELEGRFPSGDANLCTSTLYYDGLRSAAFLAKELGKGASLSKLYNSRADKLAKAIEVVQNSSPINKAVIQIAQNRNKEAAETVASLNDEDPRKWYMKAVLDSRDMDFVAGATDLDHCFQLDKKYIVIMENDGDISDDVKEMWQDMYGSAMSE